MKIMNFGIFWVCLLLVGCVGCGRDCTSAPLLVKMWFRQKRRISRTLLVRLVEVVRMDKK